MRSLLRVLAVIAVVLGLAAAAGCDPTLDATDLGSTSPEPLPSADGLPAPTASSASHGPTAVITSPAPSPTPSTAPASPSDSGTPHPTALATDTAGGSGRAVGVPTSYAEATTRLAALKGAPHRELGRFSTPGDVVYCVLHDPYVPTSCELSRGAIRDPRVCGRSMADAVGRIQLGDDGASPQCNSDTIREPGATVVAAPAVVTDGALQCAVEKIGVTCVSTRTHGGFFLTPGRYTTFSH